MVLGVFCTGCSFSGVVIDLLVSWCSVCYKHWACEVGSYCIMVTTVYIVKAENMLCVLELAFVCLMVVVVTPITNHHISFLFTVMLLTMHFIFFLFTSCLSFLLLNNDNFLAFFFKLFRHHGTGVQSTSSPGIAIVCLYELAEIGDYKTDNEMFKNQLKAFLNIFFGVFKEYFVKFSLNFYMWCCGFSTRVRCSSGLAS